ncbi:TetR/AcrR family transcriptional regulator [Demequina sp. NBRC 110055]|uniref:TetR/AcrR family transcriptional regulator n=1 Tax=Demequina sp. NBRC 110055 TaxID=1570344 RepID=UPI000A079943|nr:TetR/AcrR family transcriptional regulator [Demequina sp. NBRC 110055]
MPKIDEATVAEHRAARLQALLDAAIEALHEHPESTPSLADVGQRAGLSRSSVYHYFSSSDALLEAVIAHAFPQWERRFEDAYAPLSEPGDIVRAFIHENLAMVAGGQHALAKALSSVGPAEALGARASQFHRTLMEPLLDALTRGGEQEPQRIGAMINTVVVHASRRLESGESLEDVERTVLRLLGPYLDTLSAPDQERR